MKISRLHYITANPTQAEKACSVGVDWIQLRVKNKSEDEWKTIAQEAKRICKLHNAKLIINDSVKLAKIIGADGVHLGKEDMPADEARKLLGPDFIIGGTANTFEDVLRLASLNVDYIGLGPFRFTQTKKNLSPLLGLQGYRELIRQCVIENITVPVIAIGGIQLNDVNAIIEAGVYGIAVSSAISESDEIALAAAAFIEKIKTTSHEKQSAENR
jgi:thiamine-phosphate pyrophosphorylase